jgi:hypothetical protein
MIIAYDLWQLLKAWKNCQGMSVVFISEDRLPSHCQGEKVLTWMQKIRSTPVTRSCLHLLLVHGRFCTRTENIGFMKLDSCRTFCSALPAWYICLYNICNICRIRYSLVWGQGLRQGECTKKACRSSSFLIPAAPACVPTTSKSQKYFLCICYATTGLSTPHKDKAGLDSSSQTEPGTVVLLRNHYWAVGCLLYYS